MHACMCVCVCEGDRELLKAWESDFTLLGRQAEPTGAARAGG